MIEKLNIDPTQSVATNYCIINKLNEVIDYINHSNHEYKSIDDVVDDVVKSNETAHKFAFTNKYLQEENSKLKDRLEQIKDVLYEAKYALEEIISPNYISHEQEMAQEALDKVNAEIKAITGE